MLNAVASLASSSTANQGLLGQAGACHLVCDAMDKNLTDRNIQCEGAEALVALINHHPENQSRVVEAGGINAVCAAMSGYGNDRDICMRGVRALANISWGSTGMGEGRLNDTCSTASRTLCVAMSTFANDRNLQLYGCRVLANMACDLSRAVQSLLGSVGACEIACAAMRNYADDRDVSWYALGAVANLALSNNANIARLGKAGACTLIGPSMSRFKDRQVQLQGLRSYVCLAKGTDEGCLVEQLAKADACQLVCQAMCLFPDDRVIQMYGLRAIDGLTGENGRNIQLLIDFRACQVVSQALKNYTEDREVQTQVMESWFRMVCANICVSLTHTLCDAPFFGRAYARWWLWHGSRANIRLPWPRKESVHK